MACWALIPAASTRILLTLDARLLNNHGQTKYLLGLMVSSLETQQEKTTAQQPIGSQSAQTRPTYPPKYSDKDGDIQGISPIEAQMRNVPLKVKPKNHKVSLRGTGLEPQTGNRPRAPQTCILTLQELRLQRADVADSQQNLVRRGFCWGCLASMRSYRIVSLRTIYYGMAFLQPATIAYWSM